MSKPMKSSNWAGVLALVGPGILVAATGVGAGDLATGAFAGSKLGVAILWAVLLGALLKFVLNEGLARWQLATGDTLLEGCIRHFGMPFQAVFLSYLLFWTFCVGSALISACGAAAHALLPLMGAEADKILYGLIHSGLAVILVQLGGYRLFGKIMSSCIAVMFVTVLITAVVITPSWPEVAKGLVILRIPEFDGQGLDWTVALMGGVGGTLTVLCYGYWIREVGRTDAADLKVCRIDLAVAYAMTALFGICMVILGSRIELDESRKGAELLVSLADQLQISLGSFSRWAFLIGAWGAISSSLLGVWQSVPYLFADFWNLTRRGLADSSTTDVRVPIAQHEQSSQQPPPLHDTHAGRVDTCGRPYRIYLYFLASFPAVGLWFSFENIQKLYAIVGAAFMPLLALSLLVLNGRTKLVGKDYRNSPFMSFLLIAALLFFVLMGAIKLFPDAWVQLRLLLFAST